MKGYCLEVSGPLALFSRPEMKVERVSYDVITPSAARAIFDAILWKPAIRWAIRRIEVLAPIRWTSIRRNELGTKASPRSSGVFVEEDRQQRASLLLCDVCYRLHAEFEFIPPGQRQQAINPAPEWLQDPAEAEDLRRADQHPDECEAKYAAMFQRRARKGQCFTQPYLGCREFAAQVRLVEHPAQAPPPVPEELRHRRELGWMLYDLDFSDPAAPQPLWYRPTLDHGIISVPPRDAEEVRR